MFNIALRYVFGVLLLTGVANVHASAEGKLNSIVAFRQDQIITAATDRLKRNFLCTKEDPEAVELAGVRRDNEGNDVDEYLVNQNVLCPFSEGHVAAVVRFTKRDDVNASEITTTVTQVELTPVAPPPAPSATPSAQ